MKNLLSSLAALVSLSVAAQDAPARLDPIDAAIEASATKPVGETVVHIAKLLSMNDIVIPSPNTGTPTSSAQFLTAQDKDGNVWLYIYSDTAHAAKVLPNDTQLFVMSLSEFRHIVEANDHFRGIYINSSYPVPRELFGDFFSVVN